MASPQLTEEDKSTKLYQWVMHRTKQPPNSLAPDSDHVMKVYDEQASYYDELYSEKMGWTAWREGADILHRHLEKMEFKKEASVLDAGAGTGLVGKSIYRYNIILTIKLCIIVYWKVLEKIYLTNHGIVHTNNVIVVMFLKYLFSDTKLSIFPEDSYSYISLVLSC